MQPADWTAFPHRLMFRALFTSPASSGNPYLPLLSSSLLFPQQSSSLQAYKFLLTRYLSFVFVLSWLLPYYGSQGTYNTYGARQG